MHQEMYMHPLGTLKANSQTLLLPRAQGTSKMGETQIHKTNPYPIRIRHCHEADDKTWWGWGEIQPMTPGPHLFTLPEQVGLQEKPSHTTAWEPPGGAWADPAAAPLGLPCTLTGPVLSG